MGGVCGGIAEYLGWSPTLVRALMLASVFVYGFGAAFYAFAWALLPDRNTGVILAQQLIDGLWDWVMLGPICCLAVSIIMPGMGVVVAALAAGGLLLLVNHRAHYWRQMGYDMGQPQDTAQQTGPRQDSEPYTRAASQPVMPTRPVMPPQPAMSSQPHFARPLQPRVLRRKPAGFAIVLVVMAAILLTVSWVLLAGQGGNAYLEPLLRLSLWGITGICLLIGVIILVLGAIGRRAGGLTPLAWVCAFVAITLMAAGTGYSSLLTDMRRTAANYTQVTVSGYQAIGADDHYMDQLRRGMAFQGDSPLNGSAANIDLSHYGEIHGTHQLSVGQQGTPTVKQSGCPTGPINLTAYKTQVFITLPDGCSYGFGDMSGNVDIGRSAIGGNYTALRMWNGFSHSSIGLQDWYTNIDTSSTNPNYQWRDNPDAMPTNGPELIISTSHVIDATVTVQYQSDSHMPKYGTDAR